jgi:DNA-binding NarL/FixJ family response regulator
MLAYPTPRQNLTEADFTPAQLAVLHLIARGLPDKVIAWKLNRSYHTVRDHKRALMAATGFTNSRALAVWWALYSQGCSK